MYYKPWDRTGKVHVHFKAGSSGPTRIITEDMKAAAEVATKQWNDYQTRFSPFENKFIADVNKDPAADNAKVQGMVNADLAQKAPAPAVNPIKGMAPPTTGRALAAGLTDAAAGAQDRRAQGLGTVVAMGRGQQVEALNGMTDQAITSGMVANQKAITDSRVETAERGQTFGMIGSGLGAASGVAANYSSAAKPVASYEVAPGQAAGPTAVNADYNTGVSGMNRTVSGGKYLQPVQW